MNALTDLADLMLNTASTVCACLEETPNGAPGNCGIYWGTLPPDDYFCDCGQGGTLDVWMERLAPTQVFPQPFAGPLGSMVVRSMASIAVRLTRPCWPAMSVDPGGIMPPTRETTEVPSINLTIDASAVYCCLLANLQTFGGDSPITGGPCNLIQLGALVPDRNRALCAGFSVRFVVDMGECCVLPTGS